VSRLRGSLRLLVVGGFTSYRALFNWLSPWILVPVFVVDPLTQLLLFVYVGRSARLADDSFFVIGNALLAVAVPCLFGMTIAIGDERRQGTLPLLLVSPAARVPLFLGRALPVILNGVAVSVLGITLGALLLDVDLPPATWLPLLIAVVVTAFSCTGLGLVAAALGLRARESTLSSNVLIGVLLIFTGANVPRDALPGWMTAVGDVLPITHGIAAARTIAAGGGLADAAPDLVAEAVVGLVSAAVGLVMLRMFEAESRRRATLELA
jgi:ABC-2 type transport system permease protein